MSDKVARSYTNVSNRAKAKDAYERKVVYKSVLDNPFTVQWPRVPTNLQNAIISQTVAVLDGVAAYHTRAGKRAKRKSVQEHTPRKRRKTSVVVSGGGEDGIDTSMVDAPAAEVAGISNVVDPVDSTPQSVAVPDILKYVTFGINEVTKKLEGLSKSLRRSQAQAQPEPKTDLDSTAQPSSQLVLVCTGDINPSILVEHLPSLVAACNSARLRPGEGSTWLVPLPAGAEQTLSVAAGLRRVSALLLDSAAPQFEVLQQFLSPATLLRASWLLPASSDLAHTLVPTHIKQLRTTAPKDMKAAKDIRAKRRAEAKAPRNKTGTSNISGNQ